MNYSCPHCNALWRKHALSVAWPVCSECHESICSKCSRTACDMCGRLVHAKCANAISDELFCEKCWTAILRDAVAEMDLEMQLEASIEWANAKR
jgi:hypothetical protein